MIVKKAKGGKKGEETSEGKIMNEIFLVFFYDEALAKKNGSEGRRNTEESEAWCVGYANHNNLQIQINFHKKIAP